MIKIENIVEPSAEQMVFAIQGMRNPMNSWNNSDTSEEIFGYKDVLLGENDKDLMNRLRNAGTEHRKYMRQMPLMMRITAPMYWWKEFDTYKVGTTSNSTSTMHKIHSKEFTMDDFSTDHLFSDISEHIEYALGESISDFDGSLWNINSSDLLEMTIKLLNAYREKYLETKDKNYWYQLIQLLPSSYNQTRNVSLNYEVALNMYKQRKYHKLDEWREFCKALEKVRYGFLIEGEQDGK